VTRGRRGPAPAREIGPQEAPAKKPQRRHSADDDRQPTGGELLRRRLDRTAAVTVLSLAAQAAGVGQANAFGVIWRALWGAR
jgi:hypothetical protein